jgi:hypothetical protein
MFGRQDDHLQQQDNTQIPQQSIDSALAGEAQQVPASPPPVAPAAPQTAGDISWQHPGTPLDVNATTVSVGPAAPVATTPILPPDDDNVQANGNTAPSPSDLFELKQQALAQLSPLVGHLEQSPEEKFRTTMMMIQASDDQSMLGTAYAAAQSISDEKIRAQALLDVVNEINYFTQNQQNG